MNPDSLPLLLAVLILGLAGGWALRPRLLKWQREQAELSAKHLRDQAGTEAKELILKAKDEALKQFEEIKIEERERRKELKQTEDHLTERERQLASQRERLERDGQELSEKIEVTEKLKEELAQTRGEELKRLEAVAKLSQEEAYAVILERIEKEHAADLERAFKKLEQQNTEELERKARDILVTAIQRYGASNAVDVTTSAVSLPSDDLKGRIIGKEGRNIKALERATGCEVLVDDTPGAVVISSFDPVRREVARRALERLLIDGRIQPARIEEIVEDCRREVEDIIRKAGEDAVEELGIMGLDPRLIYLIGRLRFRTSYGQNVLQHSVEAAHIAGMIAAEVGANVAVAKKGALVHDIGKAIDHEVEGTHVEIGRKLLARFGVEEEVVKAMQSHHEEYPFETPESIIVKVAESISAARPGARRDSVENYLKRLSDLENIGLSFEGVEKVYAIQAGREVRVFVTPETVDDLGAKKLARAIAEKIEQDLQYPGEIKVHVIRESRVVDFAR